MQGLAQLESKEITEFDKGIQTELQELMDLPDTEEGRKERKERLEPIKARLLADMDAHRI